MRSITAFSFSSCVGRASFDYTLTTGEDFPYHLNADSYDATSGETTATVTGVVAALSGNFCGCGYLGHDRHALPVRSKVNYTNGTHKLRIVTSGGTLHVYHVNPNCAEFIGWNSGDHVTISGTYTITPKQAITSP